MGSSGYIDDNDGAKVMYGVVGTYLLSFWRFLKTGSVSQCGQLSESGAVHVNKPETARREAGAGIRVSL